MGDMADMFLEHVEQTEMLRDDYSCGNMSMEDAYDYGFLDETGCEIGMQDSYGRNGIPTLEYLQNQLKISELELSSIGNQQSIRPATVSIGLTKQALLNVRKNSPTCNVCLEEMQPQDGKFGKFYFCGNKCEGQKTVSDSYWQSLKVSFK